MERISDEVCEKTVTEGRNSIVKWIEQNCVQYERKKQSYGCGFFFSRSTNTKKAPMVAQQLSKTLLD